MTRTKVSLSRPVRQYAGLSSSSVADPQKEKIPGNNTHHPTPPYREGGGCGDYPQNGKTKRSVLSVDEDVDNLVDINTLSLEQKKQLLAQLSLAVQEDTPSRDSDMWAVALSRALQDALTGSVGASGSVHTMKRTAASGAVFSPVLDFMRSSGLIKQPVTVRVSVYHMLAELVVAHARRISRHTGAPLGAKLLSTCQANIASLFDEAFPGYLRSGLAVIVAKQLGARRV